MRKKIILLFLIAFCLARIFSQEALKSTEEEYYDFLSLTGVVERPTLGYRTLSDSVWNFNEDGEKSNANVWKDNNLGTTKTIWESSEPVSNWFTNGIYQGFKYKIYGPEWYNSFNSAAPYGQNDGALWQGRGYNTSLTGGARIEGYGFEVTFKPQISFSQNMAFEYTKSKYSGANYENKAAVYGDYSLGSLDAPQRFGDKPLFNFDLGDTEIRWSWNTFTMGFGTQNIWLGPAQINPIIHSNNAPGYPHFDFGLRKQRISIKNIDLGDIEFRYWLGKTTESDFFDNDSTNDNNLITGLSVIYNVPFFDGLRIGLNRTMLSKWDNKNAYTLFTLLIPFMQKKAGYDESDQRASIFLDYYIPNGGIDIYFEWGKNDYNSGTDNIMRYPFHTQAITAGFKKTIEFTNTPSIYGQFLCELTFIETSMDYHFFYDWGGIGSDFYSHRKITQGYTNKGQYIGAGIGAGGNAQSVSYKLYYPKGYTEIAISRINPDLNYSYFLAPRNSQSSTPNEDVKSSIRVLFNIGVSSKYFITDALSVQGSLIFSDEHNPLNKNDTNTSISEHRFNIVSQLNIKYLF